MEPAPPRFKPALLLVLLTAAVFLAYSLGVAVMAFILAILTQPTADLAVVLSAGSGLPGYVEAGAVVLAAAASLPLLKLLCRNFQLRLDVRWPNRSEWLLTAKYFFIHFAVLLATGFLIVSSGLAENSAEQITRQQDLFEGWGFWPTILLVVVVAPIFEELLFRGFLFAGLRRFVGFWSAFFVSGLFFTLLHFRFGANWQENLVIFMAIFGLTYFLTRAREKTSNLAVPIILHSLHNLRVVLAVFWLEDLTDLLE